MPEKEKPDNKKFVKCPDRESIIDKLSKSVLECRNHILNRFVKMREVEFYPARVAMALDIPDEDAGICLEYLMERGLLSKKEYRGRTFPELTGSIFYRIIER